MKTLSKKVLAGSAVVLASGQAAAFDWSTVTGGIDFSGEIAGVAAIVGILAGVLVVRKGATFLLGMLRG
jgi:hypothetical protein